MIDEQLYEFERRQLEENIRRALWAGDRET